jgi:SAM-dependent methyltransferase
MGRIRAKRLSPERIQRDFYTAAADSYDRRHVNPDDEHTVALNFMSALIEGYQFESVLDVGAGTGRGVKHFLERHESVRVRGVEPVAALIDEAVQSNGVPGGCIVEGSGEALPFPNGSFDVVCELAVLHHVGEPESIIAEMARVARRAVFLSDTNRYGRGSAVARWSKLALRTSGLWPLAYRLRNRGKPYYVSEGDGGIAYSYSIYDSLGQLNAWADRVFVVPTVPARDALGHPMLGATHALLCALRDG